MLAGVLKFILILRIAKHLFTLRQYLLTFHINAVNKNEQQQQKHTPQH
jgi:hypothetical protein